MVKQIVRSPFSKARANAAGEGQAVEEAEGGRGCPEIIQTEDLAGAVEAARRAAGPGDVVVLSPACAAFDRFKNFMERGRAFKELVRSL